MDVVFKSVDICIVCILLGRRFVPQIWSYSFRTVL
jgi:hypothetical protein